MKTDEILQMIIEKLQNEFPTDYIFYDKNEDFNEYFILVDSQMRFESDDYQHNVFDITMDILLKNGIDNIFFAYENSPYIINMPAYSISENLLQDYSSQLLSQIPLIVNELQEETIPEYKNQFFNLKEFALVA